LRLFPGPMGSSKIGTAAPSASTIPARSRLNGRRAVASSRCLTSRPTETNEANTRGVIGVSDAPATAILNHHFELVEMLHGGSSRCACANSRCYGPVNVTHDCYLGCKRARKNQTAKERVNAFNPFSRKFE
jgi:hypothetical protein